MFANSPSTLLRHRVHGVGLCMLNLDGPSFTDCSSTQSSGQAPLCVAADIVPGLRSGVKQVGSECILMGGNSVLPSPIQSSSEHNQLRVQFSSLDKEATVPHLTLFSVNEFTIPTAPQVSARYYPLAIMSSADYRYRSLAARCYNCVYKLSLRKPTEITTYTARTGKPLRI